MMSVPHFIPDTPEAWRMIREVLQKQLGLAQVLASLVARDLQRYGKAGYRLSRPINTRGIVLDGRETLQTLAPVAAALWEARLVSGETEDGDEGLAE
jgi:hypothetical protein